MSDEDTAFPPADEEEERAASALRQALEGRAAGPELPAAALETAALLRFSGASGPLADARKAALRQQLLAGLPAAAARPARRSWRSWFALGLPLVGAAAAIAVLVVGTRTPSAPDAVGSLATRAAAPAGSQSVALPSPAAPLAQPGGPAAPAEAEADRRAAPAKVAAAAPDYEAQSRAYRARLLEKTPDARVQAIYAELDRARTPAELEQAQTHLGGLVGGELGGGADSEGVGALRQDVFCRLAQVALRLGQPQAALDWARRGLELDGAPNPFLAQLFALQGQARSALGDANGAAKSYLKALEVNERLLDESLDPQ